MTRREFLYLALCITIGSASAGLASADSRSVLAERVMTLTRDSPWTLVSSVTIPFRTYHPQGLIKTHDGFIVSSVEVRDRAAGQGVGHLFKVTPDGNLVADLKLGEGAVYHPGGIDFDGTSVWVPVAEYRPDSRSIIYRVDPQSMRATEILRFADHIGAIVHNTDDHTLHGVSWGSRRFYRWTLDKEGRVTNANVAPERLRTLNPSHYVDYQDCKYVGGRRMLCTGVSELQRAPGAEPFRLGGIDLVDLGDGRPIHQVPVLLWTAAGLDMTHNPVWLEPTATGMRGYFMPEDNESRIYIYEAAQVPRVGRHAAGGNLVGSARPDPGHHDADDHPHLLELLPQACLETRAKAPADTNFRAVPQ